MPRQRSKSDPEEVVSMTVRVPPELLKTARKLAIDYDITFQTAVKQALELWVNTKTVDE